MAVTEELIGKAWLAPLILCILYVANQTRKYHRLSQFKGPFSSGWSEIPHINAIITHRSHLWYKEVTDRYGECTRSSY